MLFEGIQDQDIYNIVAFEIKPRNVFWFAGVGR